jgi:hypothetical protein
VLRRDSSAKIKLAKDLDSMKKLIASAVLVGALVQVPAHAQSLDNLISGIDFTFGGFGTAGVVHTNTDQAQFISGAESTGANKSFRADVDSNIAVQATARFAPWIAVTGQVIYDDDGLTDTVNWLYLKLDPLDSLSFKLGRFEAPLFAISDSRDIGYANTWLRAPQEVYGLASYEEVKGGEGTYTLPIASTRLKLTAYAGVGTWNFNSGTTGDADTLRGYELRWETDWVTLRASFSRANIVVSPVIGSPKYTFAGYGAIVDHNNIVAQAEWVDRRSPAYPSYVNSHGWYVLGGYRFDKVLPFVSYATTNRDAQGPFAFSYDQDSTAIGVRWDAFKSADLKLQVERVNPKGTAGISFANVQPGFGNSDVDVVSLALDFVF